MADFSALKTAIQTYIKQNGNEEITGDILQEILLSVVTTLGDSAINDLISALADEVAARQNADGTLQQNITNEATARGNADTALSNRLGSTITAENTAAEQIGAEAEAREAADTALQGFIDGITDNIENGYVYAGIATPSTTPATGKVFYLALTAGTYTNFGSTEVYQGINILKYNGSAWSLDAFIGIDDIPTPNSPKLVKSGGAFDSVMTNGSAFDISAHFASGGTLATYADLSAALAALNTLSASYKRGGMSIKFVQSSDNKYVQYRYMLHYTNTIDGNAAFLNVNNWQRLDDGNILLAADQDGVFANIDTSEMTFSLLTGGGIIDIGGVAYSVANLQPRYCSLKDINYPVIAITINKAVTHLYAEDVRTITNGDIVLAIIRVDAALTPTSIVSTNASFPITIDGKSSDAAVRDWQDSKAGLVAGSKAGLTGGKVLFVYGNQKPAVLPNFDIANMTFTWPSDSNKIIIGNIVYDAPDSGHRTVSLSGINVTTILLVYNITSHNISAHPYGYTLTDGDIILAIIRTNAANTPTDIHSIDSSFEYTINSINRELNSENILLAADSDGVFANIKTSTMTFTLLNGGGLMVIGGRAYPAPTGGRDASLLNINYVVVAITYNISERKIYAEDPRNIVKGNIVFAIIRTNAANTPTSIVSVNAPFPVKINGVDLTDRVSEIETLLAVVPTIKPYIEVYKSIPALEIPTEFQSMTKVGNEFWIATGGSGAGSGTLDGYIYRYDLNWNYINKMPQSGFHFNSMSYDEVTDRLITGEAGEGSKDIYIFNNVSSWPNNHVSTPISSSDIERVITVSQVTNRPNPVWAERNAYGHRNIILSANLNHKFIKIILGYGTEQLSNGTYTASADGVPNGTYDIIWNRDLTIPAIVNTIGSMLPYSPTVCQDIDFYKGKIYVMTSAVPTLIMELTPTDSSFDIRVIYQLWSNDAGTIISNCANEGIMHYNGCLYCGIAAIGMDTTITDNNNKILKFEI